MLIRFSRAAPVPSRAEAPTSRSRIAIFCSPSAFVSIASSPASTRRDSRRLRTKSWSKSIRRNWPKWAIRCALKSAPMRENSCAPCSPVRARSAPGILRSVRTGKSAAPIGNFAIPSSYRSIACPRVASASITWRTSSPIDPPQASCGAYGLEKALRRLETSLSRRLTGASRAQGSRQHLSPGGRLLRSIRPRHLAERTDWKKRCADWKLRYPVVLPEHRVPKGRVSIYHLADVFSDELRDDDYIVSGSSGSGIELFLLALRVKAGQRVFHTTALGAMGFGIAASIGACIAGGRRRTVCVDGDGGFQFNIQELETVARLQLPIKFFVLSNEGYASIRASQASFFGEPTIGCDRRTGQSLPDIRKVAQAYGLPTDIIADQSDLRSEVQRVLNRPGPLVCDVHMILDEVRAPRLSSVQRPDGSFVSKTLEDLWPFLEREEFYSNMLIPVSEE